MGDIAEFENKMTIFYRKANGEIKNIVTGIQDMSFFGEEEGDYSLIWDYVVLDKDDFVISNPLNFKVNIVSKQLEIKLGNFVYPVAE